MNLRQQLHQLCSTHILCRIKEVQETIAQVQDALSNETKSSAGDKYETAREMLQQEMDLNTANLSELYKIRSILDHLSTAINKENIAPGCVVHTNKGNYYLAAGAGTFTCNGTKYYTISPASPIGKAMAGLRQNDSFIFNNTHYTITEIL